MLRRSLATGVVAALAVLTWSGAAQAGEGVRLVISNEPAATSQPVVDNGFSTGDTMTLQLKGDDAATTPVWGWRGRYYGYYPRYYSYYPRYYGGYYGYYPRYYYNYSYGYYPRYYVYPRPYYYGSFYYSYPSFYWGCALDGTPANVFQADVQIGTGQPQIVQGGSYVPQPPAAQQPANPPARQPAPNTFEYDGGPQSPVPMPNANPSPTAQPRPTVPLEGRAVSLPAQPRYSYPAYGEQPTRPVSPTRDRVILTRGQ